MNFYESAGYNSSDKTAFIQWIEKYKNTRITFPYRKESTRKYNKTKIVRIDGNLIFPERACTIDKKSGYIPIQI